MPTLLLLKKSTQNGWSVFSDDLQKNYESFRILCRNGYEHLLFADVSSSLNLVAALSATFFLGKHV